MARPNGADDIDEKILSKIPGLEDESDDDTNEQDQDEAETETEEETDDQSNDEESDDDSADQSSETAEPPQQTQTNTANTAQSGPIGVDKRGNLVNQLGQIVARAGSERRLFEKARNLDTQLNAARKQSEKATQDLQRAAQELQGMRAAIGGAQDARMSANEVSLGVRLVDMFKKDPGDFFKYVLTQMTAAGHDVSKYLPEAGAAGVSPEGIKQLIQSELRGALGPVRETRETEQRQQQVMAEVEKEYNDFVGRYPDVAVHEDVIARLIQEDANLSLDAAYFRLQSFAYKNGLDFNLPLKPQIEARQRGEAQRPVQRQNTQQRSQRPMPGARGSAPVVSNQPKFAADSDWGDIISSSLREHGISH